MKYILDVDASKVIEAVRSTGVVITPEMRHYAHYLISNMKNIGTWQLSNAVYGMVGGTADSHKWNWKDLRDVDAAFRLTYSGGITHSANGMKGDGTTGFARTFVIPATQLTQNNVHLSAYANTTSALSLVGDIGSDDTTTNTCFKIQNFGQINNTFFDVNNVNSAVATQGLVKGYYIASRINATDQLGYKDGVRYYQNRASKTPSSIEVHLMGIKTATTVNSLSDKRYGMFSIGQGFTDTQAIQQSQIVTNAQTILNRA